MRKSTRQQPTLRKMRSQKPGELLVCMPKEPYTEPVTLERDLLILVAAVEQASSSIRMNTYRYTLSTIKAWWQAYTSAPPYNRVDETRRKIIAYFGSESCADCGMCGGHLRLDSRNFPGFQTKSPLPKLLTVGEHWWARWLPIQGDWRLDPFEARYTSFSLAFSIQIAAQDARDAEFARRNLQVCVLTNSTYQLAAAANEAAATASTTPGWDKTIREYAGPPAFRSLNSSSGAAPDSCHPHELERMPVESSGGRFRVEVRGNVSALRASAGGWFMLLQVGELGVMSVSGAKAGRRFSMTSSMQLYTLENHCSDKIDGPVDGDAQDETLVTSPIEVGSAISQQCQKDRQTFCDRSTTSMRQVDECLACGGL